MPFGLSKVKVKINQFVLLCKHRIKLQFSPNKVGSLRVINVYNDDDDDDDDDDNDDDDDDDVYDNDDVHYENIELNCNFHQIKLDVCGL